MANRVNPVVDSCRCGRAPPCRRRVYLCESARMDANDTDRLIRLADVPHLDFLPTRNGKPVHLATVHRWATRGLDGRKLRTVRFGGAMATTVAWLWEFFGGGPPSAPPLQTSASRRRAIARAERELAEAGIP